MQLSGATAIVTGASGGIGAAVARELAARGARLVITGRDVERLRRLAAELDGRVVPADLVTEEGVDALAVEAGPVDAIVHCAGAGRLRPFAAVADPEIQRMVRLNLLAPMRLTRALLPSMIRARRGHVAFVTSIAGLVGVRDEAVYSATKSGLLTFADALRLELHGSGVGVSWIAPAAVDTEFWVGRGAPYQRSHPRLLAAVSVAALCADDIEHERAHRIVPGWLRAAPAVRGVAPRTFDRLVRRFG